MAVAYDLVLEDRILAHQGAKRRQRPFGREVAEMVRYAVGYQSRAFVTFGAPIALTGYDPESRRDVMALAHLTRDTIGRLYKVLPTAVVAAAMRPSIDAARARGARRGDHRRRSRAAGANMGVTLGPRGGRGRRAEPLADARHHPRRARRPLPRARAHGPALLRPHARSTCSPGRGAVAPHALMIDPSPRLSSTPSPAAAAQDARLALRHAQSERASRAASSPARRWRKRSPRRARRSAPA